MAKSNPKIARPIVLVLNESQAKTLIAATCISLETQKGYRNAMQDVGQSRASLPWETIGAFADLAVTVQQQIRGDYS